MPLGPESMVSGRPFAGNAGTCNNMSSLARCGCLQIVMLPLQRPELFQRGSLTRPTKVCLQTQSQQLLHDADQDHPGSKVACGFVSEVISRLGL